MTPPENPETPDTKTEQDVERKSVATDEPAGEPAKAAEPAAESTNGVTHEQDTTKFEPAQVQAVQQQAAQQAGAAQEATREIPQKAPEAEDTTVASSAPPPWQRVTSDNTAQQQAPQQQPEYPAAEPPAGYQAQPVDTSSQATTNFRPVVTGTAAASAMPGAAFGAPTGVPTAAAPSAGRTSVNIGGAAPRGAAAPTALRRPGRGPRRASLQVKRVDPWSVLKLALVLGFAMFLIWMVAVGVLYGVLQGMGVWGKLNGTYNELVQGGDNSGGDLISVGRVFGIAAIVGLVNVILFSALATVSAFIYNVSADLAGGVEVTLSERE